MTTLRELPERTLRSGLLALSHRRRLGDLATRTALTRAMVARFVAGETLADALDALATLKAAGFATTVDVLGESVTAPEAATAAADRYLDTLTALHDRGLEGNVSLKLTQMGLDLDPALCRANLERIFGRAAETGAFVRVDMEDHTKTDATLDLWRTVRPLDPSSGVVIQAALRRSAADVERLIAEEAPIRLCKGAYNEPGSVAFAAKAEVDASYATLAERLLSDGRSPAFATHDAAMIDHAVRFAREHGVDRDRFEFQMLYGIRRDLQDRLLRAGYRVRIYVPYGREWYPYFMRRLAERPANVAFLMRAVLREGRRDGMGPGGAEPG
jgi:proline dehydrogenase